MRQLKSMKPADSRCTAWRADGQRLRHAAGAGRVAVVAGTGVGVVVLATLVWSMGFSGAGAGPLTPDASPASWYTVQRQDFDLVVTATGELEAKKQVEVKCEVEANTTIVEIVPEGKSVKEGDVLARLADDQLRDKVEEAKLRVAQADADKVSAEQTFAIDRSESASAERDARLKLELADLDLSKWKSGTDPQKRRELALALEKAKRTLDRAVEDLALSEQLFAEEFISRGEVEDDKLKQIEAENALETAKLEIEVYNKYARPKEQYQFESDVQKAREELDRTLRKNESKLTQSEANLTNKTSSWEIRKDQLAKAEDQLAKTVIKAPQDGTVVYATSVGPNWRRGDPIQQGRQVRFNETVIVLPDTRHMVAALKVHEAMINSITADQPVTITIDARAGQTIAGKVTQIAVMAESGNWFNPDLREYTVRVDMPPEEDGNLKPAMRCTGQIVIGSVRQSLAVPVQAVFSEGDQRMVYVPDGFGRVRQHPVVLGRASDTLVEINEGLEEGDLVLLRKPKPGEVAGGQQAPAAAK